ncbi:MAG: hypothetical protein HKN68_02870 [Saprospiraceae bacterium]|nr:hypothetical protein [Saprospiraceae bacterium]
MFRRLMKLRWLEFKRSPAFTQRLAQTIIIWIFFLYFALNFLALGWFSGSLLREKYPDENYYHLFGGFIIYYFLFDLIMRVLIQKYPVMNIKKYLNLNIKRSSIIHLLLTISLRSFFNILPLFAILPFVLTNWGHMQEWNIAWPFTILLFGIILLNNYLSFLIDRYFRLESMWPMIFMGVLMAVLFMDFNGYISIMPIFHEVFIFLTGNVFTALIPAILGIVFYWLNYLFLQSNMYVEDIVTKQVSEAGSIHLGFLDRFGQAGKLMNLEMKLIWRNKRSRVTLYMSIFFLLYPLIFFGSGTLELDVFRYFIGIFVTGIFAMSYGQLMLSWNSTHFDLLATRKIKIEDIFRAKYYIMISSCVILWLASLVYGFVDISWIRIFTLMFIFNMGVSIFFYMFIAAYNSKRIDPGKGAMMNYEGINAAHFIVVIPLMFLPSLIRWPFSAMGHPGIGELVIGAIGLLGIIFHNFLIDKATNLFLSNRYKIMSAFRKKT